MSCVVGIDQSSNAIDLVRLDENRDRASWHRVELVGATAFQRLRGVRSAMPLPHWWDDVYLAAIEVPESRFRASLRAQLPIVGAIVACIPYKVEVWDVSPADWKRPLGVAGNAKPTFADLPDVDLTNRQAGEWSQDGIDALAIALYARDLNAAGIEKALQGTPSGSTERKAA